VVTSVLVFEEGGHVQRYAGGYSDWLRQGHTLTVKDDPTRNRRKAEAREEHRARKAAGPKKLSYKLKLELESLPDRIEALEHRVAELEEQVSDPDFYNRPFEQVQPVLDELSETQQSLETAMDRWAELEAADEDNAG
jgi:ATP-binding cassette subfamily F protein uup